MIKIYCDGLNALLKDEGIEIDDTKEDLSKIHFDETYL